MAFEKFVRTRLVNREEPIVTLDPNHFRFNPVAARLAKLSTESKVIYHIDEDNRKIGFEFTNDSLDRSTYSVFGRKGGGSFRCSINEVCRRYLWIRAVAQLSDSNDRAFKMSLETKLWAIQLCPAFERFAESAGDVPSDVEGIYRYLDSDGSVIYIGKGNVRRRRNETGRDNWGIAKIEYSPVQDQDLQFNWEKYWLEKYKEQHGGDLPALNRVSGQSRNRT